MDETEEKLIVSAAVIGGVYFVIVKPLLLLFGADPHQKDAINKVNNAAPAANPFNSQYQPFVNYFNSFGSNGYDKDGAPVTYSLNDYNVLLKRQYDSLDPVPALNFPSGDAINVAIAAEDIYSAFGFFHLAGNTELVNNVFGAIQTKAQVAAIDAYLKANYNTDLWTFLKNGSGGSFRGMNATDITAIVDHVYALPDTY